MRLWQRARLGEQEHAPTGRRWESPPERGSLTFDGEGRCISYLERKATGVKTAIHEHNGTYQFDMKVQTPHVPRCAAENASKCSPFYHDQEQTPEVPTTDDPAQEVQAPPLAAGTASVPPSAGPEMSPRQVPQAPARGDPATSVGIVSRRGETAAKGVAALLGAMLLVERLEQQSVGGTLRSLEFSFLILRVSARSIFEPSR